MIENLRDSLAEADLDGHLEPLSGRETLDRALEEFGGVISGLGRELADLDLKIEDQTISLRKKDGGAIEIDIPDDLGEQISRGISSITQAILNDLPDTLSWTHPEEALSRVLGVEPTPAPRRVIGGDAVKLWDSVLVEEDEEVRGNVIAVFGDAMIEGRVDGDVIVVLGDLELTDTAEVTGQVVTVLGKMDLDEDAEVAGSVVVLDPYLGQELGIMQLPFSGGWVAFLAKQVLFLMLAFLVILLLAVFPAEKLVNVEAALVEKPATSIGYGVLVALVGHIGLILLFAVLILTVIGIPLALLLVLVLVLLGLLAVAAVALNVGRRAARYLGLSWEKDWLNALLGLCLLHAFSFFGAVVGLWPVLAPLAFLLGLLGTGLKAVAYFYGIGALVLSRFGSRGVLSTPAGSESSPQSAG